VLIAVSLTISAPQSMLDRYSAPYAMIVRPSVPNSTNPTIRATAVSGVVVAVGHLSAMAVVIIIVRLNRPVGCCRIVAGTLRRAPM
jgi:hypothetical protein